MSRNKQVISLDLNSPCRGEEASRQEVSTQGRQQEGLVGAWLLHPTDLLHANAKDLIRC